MEISEKLEQDIQRIVSRGIASRAEYLKEYEDILQADFIKDDEQLSSEAEKQEYARKLAYTRFANMPEAKLVTVIPIGYSGVQKSRKNKISSNIFVIAQTTQGAKFNLILCRKGQSELYKEATLYSTFEVKVGQFKGGGGYIADRRTKFNGGVPSSIESKQLPEMLKIPIVTAATAKNNLSKVDSSGYTNRLDWRGIRGVVTHVHEDKSKRTGLPFGVCTIMDDSIHDQETRTREDGTVVYPGFSVWISPDLIDFQEDSDILFLGTVTKNKEGNVSMNACTVIPYFRIPR